MRGTPRWVLAALSALLVASAGVVVAAEVGGATGATGATRSTGSPHTVRTVLRPVTSDGRPAAGYRVIIETVDGITCDGASPSAVDPNIRSCGFTALGAISCWRSTGHTALCLRDTYTRTLVRMRYAGAFAPLARPVHPIPQGLTLTSGTRCHVRDGGAWDVVTGHADWVGTYWCSATTLYGPDHDAGIDDTAALWRVHEISGTGHTQRITTRSVSHAYYVGTAQ